MNKRANSRPTFIPFDSISVNFVPHWGTPSFPYTSCRISPANSASRAATSGETSLIREDFFRVPLVRFAIPTSLSRVAV